MEGITSCLAVRVGVGLLAVAWMAVSPVAGAATYSDEYKLYRDALDAGDDAAAVAHARAAWHAAEEELGDNKTTAVLAYNYAQHVLFEDAAGARAALERARAIQEADPTSVPSEDLAIYLAYTSFVTARIIGADPVELREALAAHEAAGAPPTYETSRIWMELATDDLSRGRYEAARHSAERAEAALAASNPDDYRARAHAILTRGVALLRPPYALEQLQAAHAAFERANQLFPRQTDLHGFDPLLGQVLAWDSTAARLRDKNAASGDAAESVPAWTSTPPFANGDADCRHVWESRTPPLFPEEALTQGYLGALVIGFDLNDDGRVGDARVLGEVPAPSLGKYVLGAMTRWQHELPLDPRPECRKNQLYRISFYIQ